MTPSEAPVIEIRCDTNNNNTNNNNRGESKENVRTLRGRELSTMRTKVDREREGLSCK